MMAALFTIVALPNTVIIVDGETCGSTVLVRCPSRRELADMEAAAARDDLLEVMTRAFVLAGLSAQAVTCLHPEARAVLDHAVAKRIAETSAALAA